MNTALDPILDSTFDHSAQPQPVWPLAGTQLPNAHLTWAEWVEVQPSDTVARQPEKAASRRAA
jgi:hypothetical protein